MYIAQQSPKTGKYGIWLAFPSPASLISANSNIKVCQQPKWLCLPELDKHGLSSCLYKLRPCCPNLGHWVYPFFSGLWSLGQSADKNTALGGRRDFSLTVLETNLIWPSIQDVQVWLAWHKVMTFTGGFHKMMLLCW